ncbi:hypothetical protein C8J57DRAFT_1178658 [Mycena rebaudengoi]|nr:hypothetical protein C8J57DRAFT_1178658 [Mycena rebaudengoi]
MAATNSVDPAFGLHVTRLSQCYFPLSASVAVPILYSVERLRDGRSYLTRAVRARQHNQVVFMMIFSFQKEEPWQPTQQWRMRLVPLPHRCRLEEERVTALLKADDLHPKMRAIYNEFIMVRTRSPIAVKIAAKDTRTVESPRYMYWMQARDIPASEVPFQKCILSYLSDLYLLSAALRTLGLDRFGEEPNGMGMMVRRGKLLPRPQLTTRYASMSALKLTRATQRHKYSSKSLPSGTFDWRLAFICYGVPSCGFWAPLSVTQSGKLIAVTTQDSVVRADRRRPGELKFKL